MKTSDSHCEYTEYAEYTGKDLEAMSFAENYHRWIFEKLQAYTGTTVAEIGAGVGDFSSLLLEASITQLVAFEPSKKHYSKLQDNLHQHDNIITHPCIFQQKAHQYRAYFDSIFYINVLEHIEDDANELSIIYDSLKSDGHICLFVPALEFLYSEFDASVGHYRRYQKSSLNSLVEQAGFKIVFSHYFDIFGIIPWYVLFVLLKQSLKHDSVNLYDSIVVPVAKRIERRLPVPVGKNIILVAQKI